MVRPEEPIALVPMSPKKSAGAASAPAPRVRKSASAASREIVHKVEMNDTFASVSVRYGVTVSRLQLYNNFKPGDQLWARREIRIPLNVADDEGCDSGKENGCEGENGSSPRSESSLDSARLAKERTKRKSKSRSKSRSASAVAAADAPKPATPPPVDSGADSDSVASTPSDKHPVSDTPESGESEAAVAYDKPVVKSKGCVDFLDEFDKAYGKKVEQATVTSKSALIFLSKFDKKYSAVKADTVEKLGEGMLHRNRTSLVPRRSVTSACGSDAGTDEAAMLVRMGTMQTYEGKRQAQDRALDAVARILTSDFELVAENEVRAERHAMANPAFEKDLDFFDL